MHQLESIDSDDLRELTAEELHKVGGGDAWAGTPEGRAAVGMPDGRDCANAILFWSGIGMGIGAFGGPISAIGGFAIGGGMAAKYLPVCNLSL